ncbi:AAA family ATPase [Rhodococcus sp. NPDC049939]|uniref:AAA family ATPase n=1 Tax=Rhodococcus sp. NPDC049939 TaxID=3155511 RepID=UPI003405B656
MSDDTLNALPSWQEFTRPVLQVLSDGAEWDTADLRPAVAALMGNEIDSQNMLAGSRAGEVMRRAVRRLASAGAVIKLSPSRTVIADRGRELLAENPEAITLDRLNRIPEFRESMRRRNSGDIEGEAHWFVGAYYYGETVEDMTDTFVEQGIWRNGYEDKYLDEVRSIEVGQRIAIKAAYTRLHDLPFETNGNKVSVMSIKATGTVTRNHGDGRTLDVKWDAREPVREWYFYTNRLTVWRVCRGDWRSDGLIDFTFEGDEQDLSRFRNSVYWADRFGDGAGFADERDLDDESGDDEEPQGFDQSYGLTDIVADGCFVPQQVLGDYLEALKTKKNLILQGPPGTGKTWLAKRLGYALIGGKDRNLLSAIQFHPGVSYEDFVRGWRPSGDGKLRLEDGIFLDIVNAAQADPGHNHVVVVEEINRGNLAQIFGELLTLLENSKRTPDEALQLSYRRPGEPPVYLPENLYIIGTMNLADRSLAIVDFALRRRFAFRNLEPTLNEAWRRWVSEHNGVPDAFLATLAHRVDTLNDAIAGDRSLGEQYRIGHSFFTPHGRTSIDDPDAWLRQVVDSEIRPLLDEYWFDDPERVQKEAEALLGYPL